MPVGQQQHRVGPGTAGQHEVIQQLPAAGQQQHHEVDLDGQHLVVQQLHTAGQRHDVQAARAAPMPITSAVAVRAHQLAHSLIRRWRFSNRSPRR